MKRTLSLFLLLALVLSSCAWAEEKSNDWQAACLSGILEQNRKWEEQLRVQANENARHGIEPTTIAGAAPFETLSFALIDYTQDGMPELLFKDMFMNSERNVWSLSNFDGSYKPMAGFPAGWSYESGRLQIPQGYRNRKDHSLIWIYNSSSETGRGESHTYEVFFHPDSRTVSQSIRFAQIGEEVGSTYIVDNEEVLQAVYDRAFKEFKKVYTLDETLALKESVWHPIGTENEIMAVLDAWKP